MAVRIQAIPNNSKDFLAVLALARTNSKTLGFLPTAAFSNYAISGQLVGAFEKERLLGYLLYAVNRTYSFIYIVHLCVTVEFRGRGIARQLFNSLKKQTSIDFRGVRVRCRRDYEARKLWPKIGFVAIGETPGRSKQGSTLTVWWYDYGHQDLFSFESIRSLETRLHAVIDANIFFKLLYPNTERDTGAKALLNDWMQESVELCVTKEILNEIHENEDPQRRQEARRFASTFTEVSCSPERFESIRGKLRAHFPKKLSDRDEADLRQLAWTIAAEIPFFVTQDRKLLRLSDKLYDEYDVQVLRPSLLIINQDRQSRETEYHPERLAGSNLETALLNATMAKEVEQVFHFAEKESRSEFRNRLHICLAEPRAFETIVISNHEKFLGLLVTDPRDTNLLRIPILRLAKNKLASTLIRHLLHNVILRASSESRALVILEDPYLSQIILRALPELGFVFNNGYWIKVNLTMIATSERLGEALKSLGEALPAFAAHITNLLKTLQKAASSGKRNELMLMEKRLWPTKISDLATDTFIIPIRPQWAMHLFDYKLANQDLFGSKPSLMFNIENVYYRSRKPNILTAPARLLWYVSDGGARMRGTMAIRACSYLEEIVIDKPKVVFARFRRLGVYEWSHVFSIAKMDKNEPIMAFRFSNTELFSNPIPLIELRKMWNERNGSTFNVTSPIRINSEMFFNLYEIGTKRKARVTTNGS